jgi:hypothetical protein
MAKRSVIYTVGGDPKTRLSNVIAGDRTGGRAKFNSTSGMFAVSPYAKRPASLGSYVKSKVEKPLPAGAIDIRGYFGDERTGIRKNVGPLNAVAPKAKAKTPPAVVSTTTNMKLSPVKAATPARMGGLGVTTGKTTGTTATRAGTGGKTSMSSYGRAQQTAANKGGVAGPAKNSSGRNVSSASGKRK